MSLKVHEKNRIIAEMNMIPLIDVALILLIIFMVMTPFLVQSQLQVSLPKSSSPAAPTEEDAITVQITEAGAVIVEGKRIKMSGLERELILRLGKSRKKAVLVQADKEVKIEKVVEALDIAKKLGAGKVGIGVMHGAR
ncbi:MAG: biopolymer transport protein ExbD [Elusimicrobia bacterium]|nr:MAG: biopolymer transport protein ExbD [Elusimicrobiota bacterium]KAF0153452.1 MAG: biopolymer transport protein ExbD [Elusimicrobiota bacterium]